jgi:hypothetical protein
MRPTQAVQLKSDANSLFYKIEQTKNFGDKLEEIAKMLNKYYELGEKSQDESI